MSRLAFVVPAGVADPRRPSGGNAYDLRLAAELRERDWDVDLVEVAGAWPTPSAGELRELAAALAAQPDGAVVLVDGLLGSAAGGVLQGHAGRLMVVVLVHALVPGPEEDAAFAAADLVVAVSEWVRGEIERRHPAAPVVVASPGVDPAPVTAASAVGDRLLSVGAVTPTKGHDLVVEALADCRDAAWHWQVVGSLDVEPEFATNVAERARRVGVASRTTWRGPLTGADLEAAYAEADLLLAPSRSEAYGMAVTEALARGIPVLAADVGGLAEALGSPTPGALVPADDPRALASALRTWLTDPATRHRWRQWALVRRERLAGWSSTGDVVARSLEVALNRWVGTTVLPSSGGRGGRG